uniref:Neurotrophin-4 n=1 Tax=Amphilophus citrinellus TaxID=61819 RepID=A0A3Q0S2R5_AMPCI
MHWLPLVAMVIASALPFPHNPVSKIATATAEPGFDKRRAHRHDPAARLRSHLSDSLKEIRTRERSVCESESSWVDKIHATDFRGQNVTVLQEIQTQTGPLKQYFYETRCRSAERTGVAGGGCLGVDKKQWHSECKAKQSYVRALTKDSNNKIGWRWIRIDSSCVCVLLSRAKQATGREILTRRGRA